MQLKTLSGVVAQVIAAAASPKGNVTDLAQLISRDSMLSARVLQAANSAAYASGRPVVSTIPDAIRKVGCATVRNLAAATGVFDIMPESSADGFNPIHCCQHSFAVAQLCEQLASASHPEQAGLAYVVGLCHDLAEIFVHLQFNAEFRTVIETAEKTGQPQQRVERELLGITCAELSKTIFRLMGLPDAIREPIEILHGPSSEQSSHPLARILWMAENYANGIFLASSPASTVSPLPQVLCHAVTGNPNPPLPNAERLRSEGPLPDGDVRSAVEGGEEVAGTQCSRYAQGKCAWCGIHAFRGSTRSKSHSKPSRRCNAWRACRRTRWH